MQGRPPDTPDDVWEAVESVRAMAREPGVTYHEMPVPATLAPHGIGVHLESGEDDGADDGLASGWIMLLRADEPRFDWGGRWRCVAYARLPMPGGDGAGPVPAAVWDEVTKRLDEAGAAAIGGTITIVRDAAFGALERRGEGTGVEVRVSWTPFDDPLGHNGLDAGAQVAMWARFIRSTVRFEENDPID